MRWQSFALGALGLILLEVLVSNPTASNNAGGLASGAGKLAQKILSPTVPVFTTAAATPSVPAGTGAAIPATSPNYGATNPAVTSTPTSPLAGVAPAQTGMITIPPTPSQGTFYA